MRPRLLDLFSGAGGAAMGYHRAGFDVVGVDICRECARRRDRARMPRVRKAAGFAVIAIFFVWAFGRAIDAEAHYQPGWHNTRHAINLAWCGRSSSYCAAGAQAWNVAYCETGGTMSVWADNGQYLGLWQMGSYARARYGHGWNPWAQARAAHRYWLAAGWGPWECKP